jgi:transposase
VTTPIGCSTSTPPAPASWSGSARGDNRGHAALDAFAILPGFTGTLVRDDYAGYAKYDKQLTAVQLCCAHLLRSLRGIGELDTDPYRIQRTWTEPAAAALLEAKAAVDKARTAGVIACDPEVLAGLRARYDQAVAWGVMTNQHRDWPTGRHPGHTLAARLQTRAQQVWRFTVDFAVPFTNNPAEQPQRMVKLQMKIGGCWRSVRTAARYCLVRSYLATTRNHGVHPLDALRDALAGNPWMPPQNADQSRA